MQPKINPFQKFQHLFPLTRKEANGTDLLYNFRNPTTANYFLSLALETIVANTLPLTADLEIWESKGVVREIRMRVEMAPEMEGIEI